MNDEQQHTRTSSVTWFVLILQLATIAFLVSTRVIDAKLRAKYKQSLKQYQKQAEQYVKKTDAYEKQQAQYDAQAEQYEKQQTRYDAQAEQYEKDMKAYRRQFFPNSQRESVER